MDAEEAIARIRRSNIETGEYIAEMRRRALEQDQAVSRAWPEWAFVVGSMALGAVVFASGMAFGALLMRAGH